MTVPGSGPAGRSAASRAASRAGLRPVSEVASGRTPAATEPFTASAVPMLPSGVLTWACTTGVLARTPVAPVIAATWPMGSGWPSASETAVAAPTWKAACAWTEECQLSY